MLGGGGEKTVQKKYNIDYFGYAANLEVKFKLNFDKERVKNRKKSENSKKKSGKKLILFCKWVAL